MPCRREEEDEDDEAAAAGEEEEDAEGEGEEEESFLLLQQSVTVGGSGDVDRLVAQIGEALQLDAAHGSRPAPGGPWRSSRPPPPPLRPPVLQLLLPPGSAPAPLQPAGPLQCAGSGARAALPWTSDVGAASHPPLRVPSGPCAPGGAPARSGASGPQVCKRGFPQPLPGPCRRAWLRGATASRRLHHHQHHQYRYRGQPGLRAGDDDPHQLLQQLVLSGNLIKEAVRRLRRAVAVVAGAVAPTAPGAGPSFVFAPGGGSDWGGRDSISLQPSTTSLL
ncbi:GSK-3-binding protein FRAT2-like [Dromiciops gliroides]|uniref:GSK-3-binding protein FRAT2-like n=1 Tax=Dromiciops gliroides TaxID=33562 RepID=UPI001CC3E283|nr:GSK-3-binding protein FRAT2-like [Dromiciops gliroides]